jgi:hypothetical protein
MDTDDPIILRAEITRLRGLLDDYGINPDPVEDEPPKPECYGPPTLLEAMTRQTVAAMAARFAGSQKQGMKDFWLRDRAFAEGEQWPSSVRVRVPIGFEVSQ